MTTEENEHKWNSVTIADVVFLVVAILVFLGCRRGMLDDPGLGWHLRNIDAMIDQGGWLHEDPFTAPRLGTPYRTNQWLGELPLWIGWKWAGLEGIAIVTALVFAWVFRCLFRFMMTDGVPWPVAVAFTALAAFATTPSWVARPNIFTVLFVLLTARVCVLFHEDRLPRKVTFWLLPMFAVWANCHGGFLAGFAILVGTALIEFGSSFLVEAERANEARSRALHLGLLTIGCFLATLLNPYGYSLYPWIFGLLGDPFFMDLHMEWQSPNFHSAGSIRYELLLLLFPILLGLSRRRPNLVELGLSIFLLHMAFSGVRYVPLWVVVAVPLMARSCLDLAILHTTANRWNIETDQSPMLQPRTEPAPWLISASLTLVLFGATILADGKLATHNPKYIPAQGLDRLVALQSERPETRVFHDYNWGGYLTWKGWPALLNWIDDRNEVQGREHIEEHFAVANARPGWDAKLDAAKVRFVAIPPSSPLAERLGGRPKEWLERYRDGHVVIFEKPPSDER